MIKHALTLAASQAVLTHLQDQGPRCRRTSTSGPPRRSRRSTRPTRRTACRSTSSSSAHSSDRRSGTPRGSPGCSSTTCANGGCTPIPRRPRSCRRPTARPTSRPSSTAYIGAGRDMAASGFLDPAPADSSGAPGAATEAERPPDERPIPLLANVARFLGERGSPDPNHWNLGVVLQRDRADRPGTDAAGRRGRHRAPRGPAHAVPFRAQRLGIARSPRRLKPLPYSNHDLSGLPATEQRAAIEARRPTSCSAASASARAR